MPGDRRHHIRPMLFLHPGHLAAIVLVAVRVLSKLAQGREDEAVHVVAPAVGRAAGIWAPRTQGFPLIRCVLSIEKRRTINGWICPRSHTLLVPALPRRRGPVGARVTQNFTSKH